MCARKGALKGQSVVEFLTTYIWAILFVVVVLAVLYFIGIFTPKSPTQQPGTCQVYRPRGPNTTDYISLAGLCSNKPAQYVLEVSQANGGYIAIKLPPKNFNQFTVTFWAKDFNTGNEPQDMMYITDKVGPPGGTTNYIYWQPDPSGSQEPYYFITLVIDYVGGTSSFYVNGVLTMTGYPGASPGSNLVIAKYVPNTGIWSIPTLYAMNGEFSNVQLYNTTFSATQINNLYAEGMGGLPTVLNNLIGWWPMNGNSNDYSGQTNSGTPSGISYSGSWVPLSGP